MQRLARCSVLRSPPHMMDSFHLQRFVDAQDPIFEQVLRELRRGRKTGHWMWFIFPQIKGLGSSAVAQRFAISGREEALAYWRHPILGARLRECTRLVNSVEGRSVREIFGQPDDLKFRSSVTLFAEVSGESMPFTDALEKYFAGEPDPLTLERLT
jgi:uncharacterized protein (DUF1810 family)